MARLLLDRGADRRARDNFGFTTLFAWALGLLLPNRVGTVAAWCKRALPIALLLLQRGCDLWVTCRLEMPYGAVDFSGAPLDLLRDRCAVPLPAWASSRGFTPLPLRERRLILTLIKRVLRMRAELHRGPLVDARFRRQPPAAALAAP